jgi:hypothetical protein
MPSPSWFRSPSGGIGVPTSHRGLLRFILVYDYLIAYAPDEKPLWVIAVLHGSRNPRVLAAILRGRE